MKVTLKSYHLYLVMFYKLILKFNDTGVRTLCTIYYFKFNIPIYLLGNINKHKHKRHGHLCSITSA